MEEIKETEFVDEEEITIVPMLTGADHLGKWVRTRLKLKGENLKFSDLLLTSAMCQNLSYFTDVDTIFLTSDSKGLLVNHLKKSNVISQKTRHVLIIDTGFAGSIMEFLRHAFNKPVKGECLLLAHNFFGAFQGYLASGLN